MVNGHSMSMLKHFSKCLKLLQLLIETGAPFWICKSEVYLAPLHKLSHEVVPRVIQLRPNTYHGGGLLPWCARSCFIFAPSIFSPTSWVHRRCMPQEALRIFDIPGASDMGLSQVQRNIIIADTSIIPLKAVTKLLDSLSNTISSFIHSSMSEGCLKTINESIAPLPQDTSHNEGGT